MILNNFHHFPRRAKGKKLYLSNFQATWAIEHPAFISISYMFKKLHADCWQVTKTLIFDLSEGARHCTTIGFQPTTIDWIAAAARKSSETSNSLFRMLIWRQTLQTITFLKSRWHGREGRRRGEQEGKRKQEHDNLTNVLVVLGFMAVFAGLAVVIVLVF